jgi:hypothetical protein
MVIEHESRGAGFDNIAPVHLAPGLDGAFERNPFQRKVHPAYE